jgi:hypothetical protein
MKLRSRFATSVLSLAAAVLVLGASTPDPRDENGQYSVYLRLLDSNETTLSEAVEALSSAFEAGGWTLLASLTTGDAPGVCEATGRTLVVYHPDHVAGILEQGAHGAFAVPLKVTVFQDQLGLHVGVMDPRNLHRTMVAEEGRDEEWAALTDQLIAVAESAFPGQVNPVGYGQWRDKGRIGRTFGIVAGGAFPGKVETIAKVSGDRATPAEVANVLLGSLGIPGEWEWGMTGVFAVELSPDVALVGVTGPAMENRAYQIVGNGNDEARKDVPCAGIDHAPAFPLNLLVQRVDSEIRVSLVDEMFRMKMYFEDAGKMAFMSNMGMPGSIEHEIREKVELILSNY